MIITKKLFLGLSAILLLTASYVTQASSAKFFADAGLSIKALEFKAQSSDSTTSYKLAPVFTMLSLSGGMVVENFYVTANLENSLFDAKLDGVVYGGDSDSLSRADRNITFGYYLRNTLSVFAGYLTGKTEDNYSSPLGNNETGTISFSENGPFVGANYLVLFTKGALSLNFAYAFLDGEYKNSYKNDATAGERKYTGDTTGISLGAKYVGQWTDNVNYYAGAKINLFDFSSATFNSEENFYIAQAGLTYKF